MRSVWALVRKEFIQVFRDPVMLRLIFVAPIIQLFLLGYAVNFDVKLIPTAVYDFDRSQLSRELARSFAVGDYFVVESPRIPLQRIEDGFRQGDYRVALIIEEDFSRRLESGKPAQIGLWVDGTNTNSAGIAIGYAGTIVQKFNQHHLPSRIPIEMRQKVIYNPEGKSVYFMVPGIVATLLTTITVMLTSMAIVREREVGTLEQVMVTPISTRAFILGKTIPFAILGFLEISLALALGTVWFRIPFIGSKVLLYGLALVYLLTTLGVGMFISTLCRTQQQAMFFGWFFTLFAVLTSGFMTPIENMPRLVQHITLANPLRYFIKIVRGIMMKGAGVGDLYPEIIAMVLFGIIIFTSASLTFTKRL